MDRLIPTFNKLQDIAASLGVPGGVELPQIVVVGAQSSGKSSVLESLVRRDFLPRGTGIVTRRPLVLRLCHLQEERDAWGQFYHLPDKYFVDFDEIRQEIENATQKVAPKEKDISAEPLYLQIFSHEVLDITLVDLPGITKVPVGGQPVDIERIVRDMIVSFISKPNAIILAISAANTDLANSDALKLAREVDPAGERTLGVLTKLDLMDRGTNALDVLTNRIYPLRLGYIGMICRSQQDIQRKVPISAHLQTEREYFSKSDCYASMVDRLGADYLASRLNSLLVQHLRLKLPELQKLIANMVTTKQEELLNYGYFDDSPEGKGTLVLISLQKFAKGIENYIEGSFFVENPLEIQGGAYINQLFFQWFRREITDLSPLNDLDDTSIRGILMNSGGLRPAFFISSKVFEMIMKRQLRQFVSPSLECVTLVYKTFIDIIETKVNPPELTRFFILREEVIKVVQRVLLNAYESTRSMVDSLLNIEMSFINVQHPDFISVSEAVMSVMAEIQTHAKGNSKAPNPGKNGREQGFEDLGAGQTFGPFQPEAEMKVIKRLIHSYFGIVRKNIGDLVPKTIVHLLINGFMHAIERELVSSLYVPSRFDELLVESGEVTTRRRQCAEELQILQKYHEVLSKVNFNE